MTLPVATLQMPALKLPLSRRPVPKPKPSPVPGSPCCSGSMKHGLSRLPTPTSNISGLPFSSPHTCHREEPCPLIKVRPCPGALCATLCSLLQDSCHQSRPLTPSCGILYLELALASSSTTGLLLLGRKMSWGSYPLFQQNSLREVPPVPPGTGQRGPCRRLTSAMLPALPLDLSWCQKPGVGSVSRSTG